jgi:hypothetical protein
MERWFSAVYSGLFGLMTLVGFLAVPVFQVEGRLIHTSPATWALGAAVAVLLGFIHSLWVRAQRERLAGLSWVTVAFSLLVASAAAWSAVTWLAQTNLAFNAFFVTEEACAGLCGDPAGLVLFLTIVLWVTLIVDILLLAVAAIAVPALPYAVLVLAPFVGAAFTGSVLAFAFRRWLRPPSTAAS